MKRFIRCCLPLCLLIWSSRANAASTEKTAAVIATFYTEYCSLYDGGSNTPEREAALLERYLTPDLVARVKRVRAEQGFDPLIRAQDFDRKAIPTLTVTSVDAAWYAVGYFDFYNNKCVVVPVRAIETDGTIRIVDLGIE